MSGQNSNRAPPRGGLHSAAAAPAVPSASLRDTPAINFVELQRYANAPRASPYATGNVVNVDPGLDARLSNINDTLKYPLRAGLRHENNQGQVLTNYFEVTVDPKTVFYEYQILNIPASESRAGKKRYMETAIQVVPFLNNNQHMFATDNINTIISWTDLHQHAPGPRVQVGHLSTGIGAEWRLVDVSDGNSTAHLNFQYVRMVDIAGLRDYAGTNHPNPTNYDPGPAENALNTIMTKCITNQNTLHLNSHKFYVRDAYFDLRTGGQNDIAPLRAMRGYSYRIKPTMGNILLNVSPANSAFWKPLLVSEVLQYGRGPFGGTPGTFDNVTRALKNVRVYINYKRDSKDRKCKHPKCTNPQCRTALSQGASMDAQHSRIKTIRGFGKACNVQEFDWDHKDANGNIIPGQRLRLTVAQYQQIQYGRTLQSPHLLAVNVGKSGRPTWFAPEDLRVLPDQIYAKIIPDGVAGTFHREACRPPMQIRSRIEQEALRHIPTGTGNQLSNCPRITLNPVMLQVPSIRLPYSNIMYSVPAADKVADNRSGRWDLINTRFLRGNAPEIRWSLITELGVDVNATNALLTHFNQQLVSTGVCTQASILGNPQAIIPTEANLRTTLRSMITNRTDNRIPDIVVLLLKSKNQTIYSNFKYLTDRLFVLQSICITQEKFKPNKLGWANIRALQQYMANVAMKGNLKMAGINHSARGVDAWLSDTLVLGADVTHPGSGALDGCPSIAAVVGSLEASGGRFQGRMQLQTPKQEIITNFGQFMFDLLRDWRTMHKKFPKNVLYYRDGVSTSQYDEVIAKELLGIQQAFTELAKQLHIEQVPEFKTTAVIVTKRHSTRFFPRQAEDAMNNNGNTKPGLLVDNIVTSPYFTDFYLQSHNGIKGTARPCHYFVLRNEMAMTTEQLEDLTHNLCHTYVRATLGVSYASPTYYADRLCERGRCYLRPWYNPDTNMRTNYDNQRKRVEDLVNTNRNTLNANRPPRPRGQRKTAAEIQEEKDDAATVLDMMKNHIKPDIDAHWMTHAHEVVRQDPDGRRRYENWCRTMYWM